MKRIYNHFTWGILFVLAASCNDFLDVNPKTEVVRDKMFNQQAGFTDALTGIYIQLKGENLYGADLTMTTIEHLISNWDATSNSLTEDLNKMLYTSERVEEKFSKIFAKQYTVIANINSILEYIDEKNSEGVFKTKGMYELIKGECLALRAYCHFDILRIFGPVPGLESSFDGLPYVTSLTKEPNYPIPLNDYKQFIFNDLEIAQALIKPIDPIMDFSISELSRPGEAPFLPESTFFAYRNIRMNYYAVRSLQARVHLWFNEAEKAYECAKEVASAVDRNGQPIFRLGIAADFYGANFNLTPEHILALYDFEMLKIYQDLFEKGTLGRGSNADKIKYELYGNTGTDIRELNLWVLYQPEIVGSNQRNTLKKYKTETSNSNVSFAGDYRKIPLIRLSEIYFILIETSPMATEAQEYWNQFRMARGLQPNTLPTDPQLLRDELMKEYRREFFAEGQAFFTYKRMNAERSKILWFNWPFDPNYNVPVPKGELVITK